MGACAVLFAKTALRTHDIPVLLLTFGLAGCTFVSLAAGALFGAYRPLPLTLGAAVFAAACWGVALCTSHAGPAYLRSNLWLVRSAAAYTLRQAWRHPVILLVLLITATVYALRAWLSMRLPATDWDGLMYHLVGPGKWIQAGRIVHTPENLWANTSPMGVELLAAGPAVFLRTMQYMPVAQMPCYLLGAFSVLSLARALNARRSHAVLAACAFLLTPAAFAQAHTNYIDVSAAAFALAALSLVTSLGHAAVAARPQEQILLRLVATGLATGLAVGAKPSNLIVLPIVALAVAFQLMRLPARAALPPRASALWGAAAVFILPVLAIGSSWYLRTWKAYGNPFYPVSFLGFPGQGSVKDVVISDDTPPLLRGVGTVSQLWTSWTHALHAQPLGFDIRLGGLGPAWVLLILPGALIGLALWLGSRRSRGPAGLLAVTAVAVTSASPAAWWGRCVLVTVGAVLPLAAYALTRMSKAGGGGYLPHLLTTSVTAATAGLLAVSGWWGHTALPVTTYENTKAANNTGRAFTPLRQVMQLTQRPDAARLVWPWYTYRTLDTLPKGSTIALLAHHKQPFIHPLTGTQLQRRTVILGKPSTADELAQHMHAKSARYILLDADGKDSRLAWDLFKNPTRFQLLNTPDKQIYGTDLFELGNFPTACRKAGSSLRSKSLRYPNGQVRVTGRFLDGCGKPVHGQAIQVFVTKPDGIPVNGTEIGRTITNDDGTYTVAGHLPSDGTRHTYSRTTGRGPLLPPAASSPMKPVDKETN
ncbi:hypothetical protein [Streptomyces lavendulocolor]|uniref:hypothetical protein n=1 Tax=Streptomyces lavendulocolor TaxID=67316 RepID=UPI0033E907F5